MSFVGFVCGFLISSDLGWWVDGGLGCLLLVFLLLFEMRWFSVGFICGFVDFSVSFVGS